MAKPTLYGPDGQPIQREMLTQEIAAPTITGVRTPFTGYPGDGLNPRRLASLLREADQGEPLRYFELAEQIEERDLHYAGVLGTRKRSVAQLEITVEAASDAADHVKHADTVRAWLTRDELQDELFDILDAIGKGVSYTEIIWDTSEGQWQPRCLEWRDPRWFRFDRVDGRSPLLRTDTGDVPLPAMKFICAVIRAKSGLPIRSGVARLATWSWMFKAFTMRDWAIFVQTFGQPIRLGKFGPGASETDKDTLFRAVANIAGDCAAIVPEGMNIEFVKVEGATGHSDLYQKRIDHLDQQVSKAVLGQTATTDAIAGGHAVGQEHRKVQEDIERADAKVTGAILNRDLVRPWIDLEYGPQKLYPKIRIGRAEDRDVTQTIDGIVKLVPLGLRVQKSFANDMLGIPEPDAAAELLTAPARPDPFGGFGLPAGGDPARALNASPAPARRATDRVDQLAAAAEDAAQSETDALIDAVRDAVKQSTSLRDLQARLATLAGEMPIAPLAEMLRLALMMAELEGRADVAGK